MTPEIFPDRADPAASSGADSADALREQAAACRRLAAKVRTHVGSKALDDLGAHFDDNARKLDPSSQRMSPPSSRIGARTSDADKAESAELKRYGIVRVPADTFVWNGYRYTHARDALAAARRDEVK